jgi:thiol-disulfide isomerase/thioredoxin
MAEKTSVVTPERFAQGLGYGEYTAGMKVNQDRFQQFYESITLSSDDSAFFRKAVHGAPKVLAISEDWCPDCYRNMPVMARIAEASGMEMRVFARDEHPDIMDEFLKEGQYQSIPVFVFYTPDHEYIGHWIERPAIVYVEQAKVAEAVRLEMPKGSDDEVTRETRRRVQDRHVEWQQDVVRELRELLSQKLGL